MSVNRFVGELLGEVTAEHDRNWPAEHEALLQEIGSRSLAEAWSREEVYAERLG
jgi:hypothetical protein